MSDLPALRLEKDLERSIARGHPWIFDRALAPPRAPLAPGQLVRVVSRGRDVAIGYCDPSSPIRVRVLERDPTRSIDADWVRQAFGRAIARRLRDPGLAATTARRFAHGEGDGLPGLVVDVYGDRAIALLDGEGAVAFWGPKLALFGEALAASGVEIAQTHARPTGRERRWIGESPPPVPVPVHERSAAFLVDLARGQKTGLFLDQRDNRALVESLAADARVLNLFSYTGGFSLAADAGGARRVTSVDISRGAVDAIAANLDASGFERKTHELVAADCFEFLAGLGDRRFDLVICDPPSFAPSEKALGKARAAYRKLNERAIAAVAPQGVLCTASCSSHFGESQLLTAVAEAAAAAGRAISVRTIRGAASDHPVAPGFPEGRYLSFLVCDLD